MTASANLDLECPTFWAFAREWFDRQCTEGGRNAGGLTEGGKADLKWRLNSHLRHAFGSKRLDEISVEDVDRYRLTKSQVGGLNPTSINKTFATLSAILEVAQESGHIARNPAAGKRRRLKAIKPRRSWLDRADHIQALLDGARRDEPRWTDGRRRALLATLTFAGLRLGEALNLRWKDVDLARGTISVRAAKTDAGIRTVNILPVLRDELDAYKTRLDPPATALVFSTNTGRKYDRTKVAPTMLTPAIKRAHEALLAAEQEPLPDDLTPHSLRRTFASLLFAVGESPVYVMSQLGHSDPSVTRGIYAKVMDRRDGEAERLKALVQGEFGQRIDSKAVLAADEAIAEPFAA